MVAKEMGMWFMMKKGEERSFEKHLEGKMEDGKVESLTLPD